MGVSTQPSLDFLGNGGIRYSNPSGPLTNLEETQGRKQRVISRVIKKGRHICRRRRISIMYNRRLQKTRLQRSCTSIKPAQKRIRTLRKLVPTSGSWSTGGLDDLFKEAAAYIVYLQIRVKAMQVMVNVLSSSDEY